MRGDRFDEELVVLMKQAGTHFMAIAIETVSEKFQKLIRKNLKIDRALQTIHWVNRHNIEVSGFFMIGFPGETLEEVQATTDFAVHAPLDTIFVSIVSPFKGTKLRTDMLNGRFGEMDSDGKSALDQLFPIVHNRQLSAEVLSRIQRETYWRFYTKPRSLMNLGKKLTNGRNVKKIVRAVQAADYGAGSRQRELAARRRIPHSSSPASAVGMIVEGSGAGVMSSPQAVIPGLYRGGFCWDWQSLNGGQ